ncbi:MAG: FtsW/RodA/SpoVE family cell cycle protein [Bacteroidales bacterium]|nr:FtsW/RodA/SpoVE family cell cycle protein [Bacteroidales bacterium]
MIKILDKIKGDKTVWLIVVMLSLYSLTAVYSSTGTLIYRFNKSTEYFFFIQFIIILGGIFIIYITHLLNYSKLRKYGYWLLLFVAIPLLILTPFIGVSHNEAVREISIFGRFSFQPADLAKVLLILYLAGELPRRYEYLDDIKRGFLPLVIPIIIVCALIMYSSGSTAIILFSISIALLFIGGVNYKLLLKFLAIISLGFVLLLGVSSIKPGLLPRVDTWQNRITTYVWSFFDKSKVNEEDNYQSIQAKIAIVNGGIVGLGPGKSIQRDFLPQAFSDFIYAIIIEEYGLLFGGLPILLLFFILFYRCIKISIKSPGSYGALLALGLGLLIVIQALVHICITVGFLPVSGQPLPLISKGGTSIIFTCVSIGLILSISREAKMDLDS